ncbi:MAG: sugar ABC transporter substrate-binding protein [Erysipelotrichaceae bacterium]|nr:sugar ABC transporter substrate-binding protein [Erysipelotrichaceae bacterium]
MKLTDLNRKTGRVCMILIPLLILLATVNVLFLSSDDISRAQVEKQHVFGATYMTMNNPYYKVVDSQIRAFLEENGDVLLTRDGTMNQQRQNEEIKELIESGAEVIFITCVDWDQVEEGIRYANEAGVPVIAIDTEVKNSDLVTCSVVSNNYHAGVLCAEHLLANRTGADILLLEHITAISGRQRIKGFTDTLASHPEFRIVGSGESDGQIENAMPVMAELLREHPEADVVMALNDPSAFGAMAAIEGAGLSGEILVYSVDGSPEAKTMVAEQMMTATCAQFPGRLASEAARAAYEILNGNEVEKEIIIPVELVTKENVYRFGISGWQ